jgi:enoyl-CoA hydratase
MVGEPDILFERHGPLAVVILNRPKSLNSLTLEMIRDLMPILEAWEADESVEVVAIRGAGERSFCAGGDVRAVWQAGKAGNRLTQDFFREEYILNREIHRYPKPFVALIDGICMGGGMGLSVHGSHRIAGDRTLVAMPETAIGLFPDVGGSWFLPRLPGDTGRYLALTGARVKAADACYLGIATHYIPGDHDAAVIEALAEADYGDSDAYQVVDGVLAGMAQDPDGAPLSRHRVAIDKIFSADSIELILGGLELEGGDWAEEQLKILQSRSPTSMKISLEQLKRGAALDFDACMTMEYRMSQACMAGHDFYEGIRAVLVDKDHKPHWQPDSLDAVTPEMVQTYFDPLGERDLIFTA